jgi:hypothetical protein
MDTKVLLFVVILAAMAEAGTDRDERGKILCFKFHESGSSPSSRRIFETRILLFIAALLHCLLLADVYAFIEGSSSV